MRKGRIDIEALCLGGHMNGINSHDFMHLIFVFVQL